MENTRMPRNHLPLMQVTHLDAHGNREPENQERIKNQWARQIEAQANGQGSSTVWARSQDVKPKPVIDVYEWPDFSI